MSDADCTAGHEPRSVAASRTFYCACYIVTATSIQLFIHFIMFCCVLSTLFIQIYDDDDDAVSCKKMVEPIEMPFGLWTRVVPRKHVVWCACGVHTGVTWRIPLNRPRAAAMRPVVKLL